MICLNFAAVDYANYVLFTRDLPRNPRHRLNEVEIIKRATIFLAVK